MEEKIDANPKELNKNYANEKKKKKKKKKKRDGPGGGVLPKA